MSANVSSPAGPLISLESRREFLADIRKGAVERNTADANGIEVSNWFSDRLDTLLMSMMAASLRAHNVPEDDDFSIICVGGNGRRRPAPYSDVDLLLVAKNRQISLLEPVLTDFVRDCWDTGFQLGHSIRTPDDVVSFAKEDIQFATSLIDMRHLMGNTVVFRELKESVDRRVFQGKAERFSELCAASRREEWMARGDSVNQLEPDVKRSPGGLRDLHLLKWVAYAETGDSRFAALLEINKLRTHELALLNQADEFLTKLRLDLHCRAGLKQDVLTRDLQLEIMRSRDGEVEEDYRRSIERFMQDYFSLTSQVFDVARRVTEPEHRPTIIGRLKSALFSSTDQKGVIVSDGYLHATREYLAEIEKEPERVLEIFEAAAKNNVRVAASLRKRINKLASRLPAEPCRASCKRFRAVLRAGEGLPQTLRAMYETRVLDWLVPAASEIRCLMQFNQYHSYTVDEHTLKTIVEVVALADDDSPVGTAYNSVRHKATLHMSLILHDIGKGRDGDHSIIGEGIAEETAVRLQTPENKKRMMMFLVRQHLVMPDLAFRRDITDQSLLVDFARLVGAPELLRMLYVLSVADIKAVGPDTWTDWKGDLMADLYDRTMLILSGRPANHLEREKTALIRAHVRKAMVATEISDEKSGLPEWIDRQLEALPPFYLMTEEPARITGDLKSISKLSAADISVEGTYEEETDTVIYRVFVGSDHEGGCFHKIAGVISGLRMDIHTAQSCTTADGMVIASLRVSDNDFVGNVPTARMDDVRDALVSVLDGNSQIDSVFRRSGLFRLNKPDRTVPPVAPHVSIDNDCSENHSVIDVFANDLPGLLYTLSQTLFHLNLSVELTRIATNVDQVVDVFYVSEADGSKLESAERIEEIREALMSGLTKLQQDWDSI